MSIDAVMRAEAAAKRAEEASKRAEEAAKRAKHAALVTGKAAGIPAATREEFLMGMKVGVIRAFQADSVAVTMIHTLLIAFGYFGFFWVRKHWMD